MAAVEITPAMVLEAAPTRRNTAARIAVYASARFSGQLPVDAARTAGISSDPTVARYEKWVSLIRARYGLPEPRRAGKWERPDFAAKALAGAHKVHHLDKGRTSPVCPLCRDGVR